MKLASELAEAPAAALPRELLFKIFGDLSQNEVAVTIRLLARDFRSLARRVAACRPVPHRALEEWLARSAAGLTLKSKLQFCESVCRSGDLDSLRALLREQWPWSARCLIAAAAADQLHVLEWLLLQGCPTGAAHDRQAVALAAARRGSLRVLRWAVRVLRCELSASVFEQAASAQHAEWREKLDWLLAQGCPWSSVGTVPLRLAVRYLAGRLGPFSAAEQGRLDVLQMLHTRGVLPDGSCHLAALEVGRTDINRWLTATVGVLLPDGDAADSGASRGTTATTAAAYGGHVGALRWLLETQGVRLRADGAEVMAAASSGRVEMLSYLLEPGALGGWADGRALLGGAAAVPRLLAAALAAAAAAGQVAAVRLLVEVYGTPLSAGVMTALVQHGGGGGATSGGGGGDGGGGSRSGGGCCTETLRWLLERGCPVDGSTVVHALLRGDMAAVQLLHTAAPVGAFRGAAVERIAQVGSLEALRWIVSHGAPLGGTALMAVAAASGDLAKVKWLYDMRCDWDAATFREAAASGNHDLLRWLSATRCPMGTDGAAYLAPATRPDGPDWPTLRLLHSLGCEWGAGERELNTFVRMVRSVSLLPWGVELLVWMVESGCPYEPQVVGETAAAMQRPDLGVRVARAAAAAAAAAAAPRARPEEE
ncbi:hypothetical protein TSOC_001854 [Tetrabaena socialis]|uniref:Ankyrin repeat domain-containing protein n=1 Tax=Tetrabaena socialis TaxID=47790 RepID=A0A2J8AFN4_9CHLO|nr:hypothetical protein TSOC_001854 [Tetrabaena socialis]|eukprot:PNH11327.1 hypothetical protein TSOC_001854 [Tetrabaena socialis]